MFMCVHFQLATLSSHVAKILETDIEEALTSVILSLKQCNHCNAKLLLWMYCIACKSQSKPFHAWLNQ